MIQISTDPVKAEQIAREPAFGYNGYYVGGYWRLDDIDPGDDNPATGLFDFYDHCEINNPNDPIRKRLAIPTKIGQISRSDQLITFCTSTLAAMPGVNRFLDDVPGSDLVTPPIMGTTRQWDVPGVNQGGRGKVETFVPNALVPLGRYTGAATVLYADGHIDLQGYDGLTDMRKWIDNATWQLFEHDVCP
jgi:prepilin-type processing-associated H-X9-DG protein